MTTYIALLRAVNVGGAGKLPMTDLKALCAELGFKLIKTYIASGNVIFDCEAVAATVQSRLEKRLLAYSGKAVGVFVRTASEMQVLGNVRSTSFTRRVWGSLNCRFQRPNLVPPEI